MIIMVCVLQFKVALNITSLFGSTYRCEQFLEKMKHCKGKKRGQLADSSADTNFVRVAVSDVVSH